jgi:alkylhydroperoxidase/carboxymuconolactone decarboxylase family protein YurZ
LLRGTLLEGDVPRTTKELIALAAFGLARVVPLRDALRASLAGRGVDAAVLDDLARDGETARLPDRTRRLLTLGRRAALQPALLTDADYTAARKAGAGDAELAELIAWSGTLALLVATSRALGATAAPRG